jgi:oxygen-dependent protoporphyrinogen oxidase
MIKIQKQKKQQSQGKGDAEVSVAPGGRLTSFFNGAQTLTDTLAEKVGDRVKLGISVEGISREGNDYLLHTSAGDMDANIVVLASPAYASSNIVKDLDGELSKLLGRIPYPHLAVVCFGYKREKVAHPLDGFGFLVPHKEGRKILGSLWDSSVFPNRASEGHVLLRSMIGGAKHPDIAGLEDSSIISMVYDELKSVMGLTAEPDMVRVYRWEKAIPQYLLGHNNLLAQIDDKLTSSPGLYLTGNSYRGIGMNDCVANSYALADQIAELD